MLDERLQYSIYTLVIFTAYIRFRFFTSQNYSRGVAAQEALAKDRRLAQAAPSIVKDVAESLAPAPIEDDSAATETVPAPTFW